jgi:hypothetical protein
MGSSVSFVPGHPLLLASISKAGTCVLQDLRLLGRQLLSAQLQGPVYDATWLTADAAAVAAASTAPAADASVTSSSSSSSDKALWLVTAGSDSRLRCYPFSADALHTGE